MVSISDMFVLRAFTWNIQLILSLVKLHCGMHSEYYIMVQHRPKMIISIQKPKQLTELTL